MNVRCKFALTDRREVVDRGWGKAYLYGFGAITSGDSDENRQYWYFTPCGDLTVATRAPLDLEVGDEIYVDIGPQLVPPLQQPGNVELDDGVFAARVDSIKYEIQNCPVSPDSHELAKTRLATVSFWQCFELPSDDRALRGMTLGTVNAKAVEALELDGVYALRIVKP